jgi:23S rRNA (cytosine1962-C5)-methyltransferase
MIGMAAPPVHYAEGTAMMPDDGETFAIHAGIDDPARRPIVTLVPGGQRRAETGHPWIYSNEIHMDAGAKTLAPGSLVTLRRADERLFGVATFNPHALIAARVLDRDAAREIGGRFFRRRLERALRIRERLYDRPYYRLVHAEADGLPGLVVDRFADALVVQANTAGMERLLPAVIDALRSLLSPAAIVLRNDSPARAIEGLPLSASVALGTIDGPVALEESGVAFSADVLAGQKTGWFFDQRDSRAFVAGLAADANVLDLYCYSGGFAVAAAAKGAQAVLGIDRSEPALALAAAAAERNGVAGKCEFRRADVFAEAAALAAKGERYDIVVADPPPFARSKREAPAALRGYRKLARLAAQLTAPAGFLFLASCSYNVAVGEFAEAVRHGLQDAGRAARVLRSAGAGPDHPVHPALPETAYLKSLTLALD